MDLMGLDHNFPTHTNAPVAELLFRACLREWPAACVQEAGPDCLLQLTQPDVWLHAEMWDEFFVYRDPETAESCRANGIVADNAAGVVHVMVGEAGDGSGPVCVLETFDAAIDETILRNFARSLSDLRAIPDLTLRDFEKAA